MAEIVNLRLARKRRARDAEAKQADENRARHGRTKAEKQADLRDSAKVNRHLDAHKKSGPDEI